MRNPLSLHDAGGGAYICRPCEVSERQRFAHPVMLTTMGTTPRRLGATALLACAFGIAGCAAATEAAPTPSPTLTTPEASTFLETMRSTEAFLGFEDEQLEEIGEDICAALRDGSTFDDLVRTLGINDFTKAQASAVIFASAAEYCPEQER